MASLLMQQPSLLVNGRPTSRPESHTHACRQPITKRIRLSCPVPFQKPSCRRTVVVQAGQFDYVKDCMSSGSILTCKPGDSVETALALLVEHRITGLPVVDDANRVVGVVSDFDLLALDALGRTNDEDLFPAPEQTWNAFKEVKSLLAKSVGKKISDVMTNSPITVTPQTSLNDATMILLTKKIRRLPVVDDDGKLLGLITRGNIVKAALASRMAQKAASS